MKIQVTSNLEVQKIRTKSTPWILISDHPDEFVGKSDPRNLLVLSFPDLTPSECTGPFSGFKDELCSEEHVRRIIEFARSFLSEELLLVSCDMGVSRSAAVGNGLIEVFDLPQPLFRPPQHQPNPWIKELFKNHKGLQ